MFDLQFRRWMFDLDSEVAGRRYLHYDVRSKIFPKVSGGVGWDHTMPARGAGLHTVGIRKGSDMF